MTVARWALPLSGRRRLVLWASRQSWLPRRSWWSLHLLRDWAVSDPAAWHRWVWRHHAGFPEIFDPAAPFGRGTVDRARLEFFEDLTGCLQERGIDPETVRSVLEVGSSIGHLLRLVEMSVFPRATVLDGVDIDAYAVEAGSEALRRQGSRVNLQQHDAADLETFLDGRTYDVVYCAGMIMYLDEKEAARLVTTMLKAADVALAITGVAHPVSDNGTMKGHALRDWDMAFVHNLDAMVRDAGGSVLCRRWDGPRILDGLSVYHLVAARSGPRDLGGADAAIDPGRRSGSVC